MLKWKIKKKPTLDGALNVDEKEFKRMSKVRRNRRLDILKAYKLIDSGQGIFVERKGFVEGRDNYMNYLEHGVDDA